MIVDRIEQDLRQLQARQKREARAEREADTPVADAALRAAAEAARADVADSFSALQSAWREQSRRALLKSGALAQAAAQATSTLGAEDLAREPGARTIKLTLAEAARNRLTRTLKKALRRALEDDLVQARDTVAKLRERVEQRLRAAGSGSISLSLQLPDEEQTWQALKEVVAFDVRYRGELPRRGFLQRLGEGRKVLFVLLMAISLGGTMLGINLRSFRAVGLALLVVFVVAVIWTYRSWQRDDNEGIDRELERARDALAPDIDRLMNDVSRERAQRLGAWLDESRKAALAQIEQAHRAAATARGQDGEEQRRATKMTLKHLDTRLRDLQQLQQRAGRSRTEADDLCRQLRRDLQQIARAPDRPSP